MWPVFRVLVPSPTISFALWMRNGKILCFECLFHEKFHPPFSPRKELGANWNLRTPRGSPRFPSALTRGEKLHLRSDVKTVRLEIFRLNEFCWQFIPIGIYSLLAERKLFNNWKASLVNCLLEGSFNLLSIEISALTFTQCSLQSTKNRVYIYIHRVTNEEPFTLMQIRFDFISAFRSPEIVDHN